MIFIYAISLNTYNTNWRVADSQHKPAGGNEL